MRREIMFLALSVALSVGAPARADIFFDFQNYGANHSFSTNDVVFEGYTATSHVQNPTYSNNPAITVEAIGYNVPSPGLNQLIVGSGLNLFSKYNGFGSDETGLGLASTTNNEIGKGQAIKLDFTSVLNATGDRYLTLTIGSIQQGEGFTIYASTGTGLTPVKSFIAPDDNSSMQTFQIDTQLWNSKKYYVTGNYLGAGTNDVLVVGSVQATNAVVPEPSTLAIAGLGALGFGANLWLRRRRGRQDRV
jgi:hypothetical protein